MNIGARIKELRKERKKSLQIVAYHTKLSKTYIWELEKNISTNPSIDVVTRIAKFFDISVSNLIGEFPPSKDDGIILFYRDFEYLNARQRDDIRTIMKRFRDYNEDNH